MRWSTTNYLDNPRRAGRRPRFHRAFHLRDIPRLTPVCRLIGHRAVVDGTPSRRPGHLGIRWVCCDRCGLRPAPQGSLDPSTWSIGERYTGDWGEFLPDRQPARREVLKALKGSHHPPGPWPTSPTGTLCGELVLGAARGLSNGVGIEVSVGSAGDDHTIAGHLQLGRLGAIYLHAEDHGQGLRRRLNPTGYDARLIEFAFGHNGFQWKLWATCGAWSRDTPRWQDGSICLDPRELLWGTQRYWFDNVGEPETITVRLPDGDDYKVMAQLQRRILGRPRGKRRHDAWTVDWECLSGIPYRDDDSWKGDSIYGSAVEVSELSVDDDTWRREAAVEIAAQVTRNRTRYHYHHVDAQPSTQT